MGKLLHEAESEVEKCATLCDYAAENLAEALRPSRTDVEGAYAASHAQSLGIILGVMPWNFPYWQVARWAIPALAAGNTCLLKHAASVQGCAEAFTRLVKAAFGADYFANARLGNEQVGTLLASRRVDGVSLTGSTQAGSAVAGAAGRGIVPSLLELGGCDAYLVLEDADIELAVRKLVAGRMVNSGQSCIGPKRIIVVKHAPREFAQHLATQLEQYSPVGEDSAKDGDLQFAPLARKDLRETVHQQVQKSVAAGAHLLLGGVLPEGPGYFYSPTVLLAESPDIVALQEEVFGPVFVVIGTESTEAGIALANDSRFGLGGGVFSRDVAAAETIVRDRLHIGSGAVNDFVRSHPALPFGGVKDSGYGRELAHEGIRSFINLKTVWVATDNA